MTRVAVTSDRFERAAIEFRSHGLDPVPLPCIRVMPAATAVLEETRRAASLADLLVIASSRVLDLLWPATTVPSVPMIAVGEPTARAIKARGGTVVAIGGLGLGALAFEAAHLLGGARVVFPHARGTDPKGLDLISRLAPHLSEFVVYETVPIPPPTDPVEAVAFASPTAVRGWLLSRPLVDLVVGVIGETTGAEISRHRPPDVIAPRPTFAALAGALASRLRVPA